MNLCELRKGPLVLTFIFDRGADCYPQVDRTERLKDDLPGVQFATVFFSRKGRRDPPGWSRGAAGRNRRGRRGRCHRQPLRGRGCPTTIFARPGGRVLDTELGNVTEDELLKAERLTQ